MENLEEKIEKSETRIFKAVFPSTTNHYDTLFGGTALHLMDEVAFICATRFSRKKMVTIATGEINFKNAIPAGTLIELIAKVISVGRTSCKIQVDIFMEQMYSEQRESVVAGTFSFVAVDDNKKPIPIFE
ncbi:acyl-CoA thioesterase [Flavobacterium adhaerens]|uniref:acyl-CoA thioesterase n=1 Tax=Flavobacterium adhaerens TaxID=3149043 RepID=UPI0032B4045C